MSPLLLSAGLALAAGVPISLVCLAVGLLVERLSPSPALRERVWTVAYHLPLLLVAVAMAGSLLLPLTPAAPAASSAPEPAVVLQAASMAQRSPAALSVDLAVLAPGLGALVALALAGGLARLLAWTLGARRMRRIARRARPLEDAAVIGRIAAEAGRLRVVNPSIRVTSEVAEPLVAGLREAAVLLPAELTRRLTADRLALVCAHEFVHLRRGDNLRLVIESLVLGLLWFAPAMLLVRARLSAAREELCDDLALADSPPAARRAYADTLVLVLRSGSGLTLQAAFNGGGKRATAMRIAHILDRARPASRRAGLLAAAALALVVAPAGAGAVALAAQAARSAPAPQAHPRTAAYLPRAASRAVSEPQAVATVVVADGSSVDVWIPKAPQPPAAPQAPGAPEAPLAPLAPEAPLPAPAAFAIPAPLAPLAPLPPRPPVPAMAPPPPPAPPPAPVAAPPAPPPPPAVHIEADSLRMVKGGRAVYAGRPMVRLDGAPGAPGSPEFRVDGRHAPAGFRADSLAPDTVERVEVTFDGQGARKHPVVNFVRKRAG